MKRLSTYSLGATLLKQYGTWLQQDITSPFFAQLPPVGGPIAWVKAMLQSRSKRAKRRRLGILFSFCWQIWEERNRRVFEDTHLSFQAVFNLSDEMIKLQLHGMQEILG
jgi:hypothetical protein